MSDQHSHKSAPPTTTQPAKQKQAFGAECGRLDCSRPARFMPHVELFDAGEQPVARIHPQLVACEEHAKFTEVDDFIPQSEWDRIVQHVRAQGQPGPVKRLSKVTWTPLRDIDGETLQALTIATHAFIIDQMQRGMFVPNRANGEQLVVLAVAIASLFVDQFELDRTVIEAKIRRVLTEGPLVAEPEKTAQEKLAEAFGAPRGQG